jgi:hypothetical protein
MRSAGYIIVVFLSEQLLDEIILLQSPAVAPGYLPKISKMSSNCDNKPDLTLSPQVRKLLELESQFTVGGFEPMPYFFEKAQGSLLWVSAVKRYGNRM